MNLIIDRSNINIYFIKNHLLIFIKMKLDSISVISEISPYFGYLDDAFRLMKKLNMKTNKDWNKTSYQLSKHIKRKTFSIQNFRRADFSSIMLKVPIVHMLFKIEEVLIDDEEKYKLLIKLLHNIERPEMMNWSFYEAYF